MRTSISSELKEPLESSAIVGLFAGKKVGEKPSPETHYDIKTIHSPTGYLKNKQEVLEEIKRFICA